MSALFRELENETTRLYETGQRAALDLIDAQAAKFPALGHRCRIAFYRACLLAKADEPDAALDGVSAGFESAVGCRTGDVDESGCRRR